MKRNYQKSTDKFLGMEYFIEKGTITISVEDNSATINYLLWHSFSEKGLSKLYSSILQYINAQRTSQGSQHISSFHVLVDYMEEKNDYNLTGIKDMGVV